LGKRGTVGDFGRANLGEKLKFWNLKAEMELADV
jgi:hypothetical protein